MSIENAALIRESLLVEHGSNLKELSRPKATVEPANFNIKDLMLTFNSANNGSDSEMLNVLDSARTQLNSLDRKDQLVVLKVYNALLDKCASTDLLDDNGNMLSPNSSLACRQEAIAKALARAIAGAETKEQAVASLRELSELLTGEPSRGAPRDLLSQRASLAFNALYEIGVDDKARVHQKNDVTCVLTVANKDLARENPADYIRAIREWTLNGVSEFVSAGGSVQIKYQPGLLNQEGLKGRTLGCALYQNTIASHYGIIETGMLPHIAEKYYDDMLGGVRLLTPTKEVGAYTNTAEEILTTASKSDWVGVSVQWADPGQTHNYHFVRLVGTVEIDGKKYVRLENPWSSEDNLKLPAGVLATSKIVGGEGNELLMEESDFKNRIYFALVKTGVEDRGETAGLNKGNTTITYLSDTFYFDIIRKLLETIKPKRQDSPVDQNDEAKLRGVVEGAVVGKASLEVKG